MENLWDRELKRAASLGNEILYFSHLVRCACNQAAKNDDGLSAKQWLDTGPLHAILEASERMGVKFEQRWSSWEQYRRVN